MGLPRRIKQMRVLGIVLIISLGCLSALDFEAGDDFEAGHAGVNEIIGIPKTDAPEEVLPQTTVKGRTAQRFFNVREKHRKERLVKHKIWVKKHKKMMKEKAKKKKKHAKEKAKKVKKKGLKKKAKEKKLKEKKAKKKTKEKVTKNK